MRGNEILQQVRWRHSVWRPEIWRVGLGSQHYSGSSMDAIKSKVRFRIVRKIAEGGMGAVYEALQEGVEGFEKRVAIKTLLPQVCNREDFVQLFVHEAKLVADLVHENIVQIYQLGRNGKEYYIVMELVRGLPLSRFLRLHVLTDTIVPRDLAIFITARIARGLAYAHSRKDINGSPMNIVHRDICPSNILVTTEGLPKIADFGIAIATTNFELVDKELLWGKAGYMSPEQANRYDIDFRSDIFSLGALLFELLAGKKIRNSSNIRKLVALAKGGIVDWARLPKDVPRAIRDILKRCLALAPEDRYEETAALARDLEYEIYKDGYGPTIQTLESYLRDQFPYLYRTGGGTPGLASSEQRTAVAADPDATLVFPERTAVAEVSTALPDSQEKQEAVEELT
ncbi:MAG: serine/threonine protein kinase [Rhodothermales bacterium]